MHALAPLPGFGLGLRRDYYEDFLRGEIPVDFVEVISENYMVDGGNPLYVLEKIRRDLPVLLHGVSMSLGSAYGLDHDYLGHLRRLAERIEPQWISDHICWTRTTAHNSHDLLPQPYTSASLAVMADNIDAAQEALNRPLVLENPSTYLLFPGDEMQEWEFITELLQRTGAYLLLDINNVVVSAHNHGFGTKGYMTGIPLDRVVQVHLAGHTDGEVKIDTHDTAVDDTTWQLYSEVIHWLGDVAVMIERDGNMPPISTLLDELAVARSLAVRPDGRESAWATSQR